MSACLIGDSEGTSIVPWDQTDTVQMIISPSLFLTAIPQYCPSNLALGSYWMRHPTLILQRPSSVLSVNYLICRRTRSCLPKPAEIEINAPGALVVISIGRAFPARSVKRSSLWNLSSSRRDFFPCFHQILVLLTPYVWIERTKGGQQVPRCSAKAKWAVLLTMFWLLKIKDKIHIWTYFISVILFHLIVQAHMGNFEKWAYIH